MRNGGVGLYGSLPRRATAVVYRSTIGSRTDRKSRGIVADD